MTAEPLENMLDAIASRWNVAIRSPWQSETETLAGWELTLIPREGNWDDYRKHHGATLRESVESAMIDVQNPRVDKGS